MFLEPVYIKNYVRTYLGIHRCFDKKLKWDQSKAKAGSDNAFIAFNNDAPAQAKSVFEKALLHPEKYPLAGVGIAVKDNIMVKGMKATCGSKMLENYEAPYSATVIEHLIEKGAIVFGKTNMDEFGMGSSSEYSYFGPVKNPRGENLSPGGSSGGSAVAVAQGYVRAALGSDTGGSVRQPAALCGICGFKPSYGRLSRYGLTAFASSLDQIGIMARNPDDIKYIFQQIDRNDEKDSTMKNYPSDDILIEKPRIAVLLNSFDEYVDDEIKAAINKTIDNLKSFGIEIDIINFDYFDYLLPIYFIISTAEASSNLSRYDGIRYGYTDSKTTEMDNFYQNNRTNGFGSEVKRRLIAGNYILSKGYQERFFHKALSARFLIRSEMKVIFDKYDFVISPTTAELSFKIGEKGPLQMYYSDRFTVLANLIGGPAFSFPFYEFEKISPSIQIIASSGKDYELLNFVIKLFMSLNREKIRWYCG